MEIITDLTIEEQLEIWKAQREARAAVAVVEPVAAEEIDPDDWGFDGWDEGGRPELLDASEVPTPETVADLTIPKERRRFQR